MSTYSAITHALPAKIKDSKVLTLTSNPTPLIGLELELTFDPHIYYAREALRLLSLEKLVEKSANTPYKFGEFTNMDALEQVARQVVLPKYKYLMEKMEPDASMGNLSLEFSYKPFTLEFLLNHTKEMFEPLTVAKDLQFKATPACGIHIWLDYAWFGDTMAERVATLENMLWFGLLEENYVHKMTKRTSYAAVNADFKAQLGDAYGILEPEALRTIFLAEKKQLVKIWETKAMEFSGFNMTFNKKGKPCVENRWFASTTDSSEVFNMIKDLLNVVSYCKSIGEGNGPRINLIDFKRHVEIQSSQFKVKQSI